MNGLTAQGFAVAPLPGLFVCSDPLETFKTLRTVGEVFLERSKKRSAQRPPSLEEWVARQPKKWQPACAVLAVNVNTPGGVTGKTIDEIVDRARESGIKISRRTLICRLPDLERHGVARQEHHTYYTNGGEIRRRPSTWLLDLRMAMPVTILPQVDDADSSEDKRAARNDAWIRSVGMQKYIDEMLAREASQSPDPPF